MKVVCRSGVLLLMLIEELLWLDILHGWIEEHATTSCYTQFKRIVVWVHELNLRGVVSLSMTVDVSIIVEVDVVDTIGRLPEISLSLLLKLSAIVCETIVIVGGKGVSILLILVLVCMLLLLLLLLMLLLILLLLLIRGRGWK